MVDLDAALDFGPWWYAPLLATSIGGLTIFGRDVVDVTNIAIGGLALVALAVVAVHDHRRRKVRLPMGQGLGRSAVLHGLIVIVVLVLTGAWGTAISSVGYDRFVPFYAALGWALTTAVLLGIRVLFTVLRRRRRVLR